MNRASLNILTGCVAVAASLSHSAELSYTAGADLRYKYDDNIRLTADDKVSLQGWIASGFWKGKYKTDRLEANADLGLEFERYTNTSLSSDNPFLAEPEAKDFNSDNQDLKGDITYKWERHDLALEGRYWRDSTLNTEFADTGTTVVVDGTLGIERTVEGASRREEKFIRPVWTWQATERQRLQTSFVAQNVGYESERFTDYQYRTFTVNWSYALSERWYIQAEPYWSHFKNDGIAINDVFIQQPGGGIVFGNGQQKVQNDTFGLRGGFYWDINETMTLNALLGGARVKTENEGLAPEFVVVLPPAVTVFAPVKGEATNNAFIGNITYDWEMERFGLDVSLDSNVQPSGDGILRTVSQGKFNVFWNLTDRQKFEVQTLLGYNRSTDDRIEDGRVYRELALYYGYRFARDWSVQLKYRYREQKRENSAKGRGNAAFISIKYKLPQEVL